MARRWTRGRVTTSRRGQTLYSTVLVSGPGVCGLRAYRLLMARPHHTLRLGLGEPPSLLLQKPPRQCGTVKYYIALYCSLQQ